MCLDNKIINSNFLGICVPSLVWDLEHRFKICNIAKTQETQQAMYFVVYAEMADVELIPKYYSDHDGICISWEKITEA